MKAFPMIRFASAAVIAAVLLVLPLIIFGAMPGMEIYAVLFVLFVTPIGSCIAASCGGMVPALAALMAGVLALGKGLGMDGLWMAGVYLGAIFGTYLFVHWKKVDFFKACGAMILAHMLPLCLVFYSLQMRFDHQLYQAAGQAVAGFIDASPVRDEMLLQFYSTGMIRLTETLQNQLIILPGTSLFAMSDAVRQDMLLSVGALVQDAVELIVPQVMVQQSILSGVACLLLSQRFGFLYQKQQLSKGGKAESALPLPELDMPPFSLWHLPRGLGWKVGLAWVAGSFLRINDQPALMMAGAVLYHAANAILIWQGAALLNFTQKAKGTRRVWRVVLPCVFFGVGILSYLGIIDQIVNLRGLRKPPEPKEDI